MKIKDVIGIYPNAFKEAECKSLMYKLEEAVKNGESYQGMSGDGGVNSYKKSTDYNILEHDKHKLMSDIVMNRFNHYLSNEYLENFPHIDEFYHHRLVNDKSSYPLLQIQKYDKGSGHYNAWHVEQEDLGTSNRLFVFILYLNDVEEGGETGFLFKEGDDFFKVKPKTGTLIIHPASWPFIHKGYMPLSSDKYILTTWLCWTS
tara:strand:+ start:495 stop:1103 length:609 start_codon:yes stop_codon:yes gene_type:complete